MFVNLYAKRRYLVFKSTFTAAVTLALAGCLALPDLQGNKFQEYYQKPDQQIASKIDLKLKESAGKPIELNEKEFGEIVLRSPIPVVLMVYTTWCEYCPEMDPIIAEEAKVYEGRIRFVRINYDKNEQLSQRMDALAFPILYLINNGKVIDRWGGSKNAKNRIKENIYDKLGIK